MVLYWKRGVFSAVEADLRRFRGTDRCWSRSAVIAAVNGRFPNDPKTAWNVCGRFRNDLKMDWNVCGRFPDDPKVAWNVCGRFPDDPKMDWNVCGRFPDDLKTAWNVCGRFPDGPKMDWNVCGRCPDDPKVTWNLSSQFSFFRTAGFRFDSCLLVFVRAGSCDLSTRSAALWRTFPSRLTLILPPRNFPVRCSSLFPITYLRGINRKPSPNLRRA